MESLEQEIKVILDQPIEEGKVVWTKTLLQPPNRKETTQNESVLKIMLWAMFRHKFPMYDPNFLITWNEKKRGYFVGLCNVKQTVDT